MSDLDHNSKVGTSADKLSQRRRALIKGSAVAIPAILTLRSGSALAATSSTCFEKYSNSSPAGVVANDDIWFREKTDCRVLTKSQSPSVTVYRDPATPLTSPPSTSTKWYSVDNDNSNVNLAFVDKLNGGSTKMISNNGNTTTGVTYDYNTTTSCYVLVHVDANGDKTTVVGISTSEFLIASDSCYASLHP